MTDFDPTEHTAGRSHKSRSSYSPTWLLSVYISSPGCVIWGWKPWLLWNKKSLHQALVLLELRWGTLRRCRQLGLLSQLFGEKNEGTWEWFNCMDCNDSLSYWFHIFKDSLKWLFLEWTTTTTSISVKWMVSGEDPVLLGGIHLQGKWQALANEVLRGQCWIQRRVQCGWLRADCFQHSQRGPLMLLPGLSFWLDVHFPLPTCLSPGSLETRIRGAP